MSLKTGFSPEMLVIGEIDEAATVIWLDTTGKGMIKDYPVNSLKVVTLDSSHLPNAIRRIAQVLCENRRHPD